MGAALRRAADRADRHREAQGGREHLAAIPSRRHRACSRIAVRDREGRRGLGPHRHQDEEDLRPVDDRHARVPGVGSDRNRGRRAIGVGGTRSGGGAGRCTHGPRAAQVRCTAHGHAADVRRRRSLGRQQRERSCREDRSGEQPDRRARETPRLDLGDDCRRRLSLGGRHPGRRGFPAQPGRRQRRTDSAGGRGSREPDRRPGRALVRQRARPLANPPRDALRGASQRPAHRHAGARPPPRRHSLGRRRTGPPGAPARQPGAGDPRCAARRRDHPRPGPRSQPRREPTPLLHLRQARQLSGRRGTGRSAAAAGGGGGDAGSLRRSAHLHVPDSPRHALLTPVRRQARRDELPPHHRALALSRARTRRTRPALRRGHRRRASIQRRTHASRTRPGRPRRQAGDHPRAAGRGPAVPPGHATVLRRSQRDACARPRAWPDSIGRAVLRPSPEHGADGARPQSELPRRATPAPCADRLPHRCADGESRGARRRRPSRRAAVGLRPARPTRSGRPTRSSWREPLSRSCRSGGGHDRFQHATPPLPGPAATACRQLRARSEGPGGGVGRGTDRPLRSVRHCGRGVARRCTRCLGPIWPARGVSRAAGPVGRRGSTSAASRRTSESPR